VPIQIKTQISHRKIFSVNSNQITGGPIRIDMNQSMIDNIKGGCSELNIAMGKQLFSVFNVRYFQVDLYFALNLQL
jgi:hypothetical protein